VRPHGLPLPCLQRGLLNRLLYAVPRLKILPHQPLGSHGEPASRLCLQSAVLWASPCDQPYFFLFSLAIRQLQAYGQACFERDLSGPPPISPNGYRGRGRGDGDRWRVGHNSGARGKQRFVWVAFAHNSFLRSCCILNPRVVGTVESRRQTYVSGRGSTGALFRSRVSRYICMLST